jgi:hypothetical protein
MTPSDNTRVTVILDARFYDYKVAEVKSMAESCKCGSYKCVKCQMRSNAVRFKWITRDQAEDFEFDNVPIDWNKEATP